MGAEILAFALLMEKEREFSKKRGN